MCGLYVQQSYCLCWGCLRGMFVKWNWRVSAQHTRQDGNYLSGRWFYTTLWLFTRHLEIGSSFVSFQLSVNDLGVVIHSRLTMCDHISSVCRSAYPERRIGSNSFPYRRGSCWSCWRILSRIVFCKSLLAGITSEQIARLQKIQNHAARLTFHKKPYDHVTHLLEKLHWLFVSERIVFKLATLFIPLFWWHFTTLPFLLSVPILTLHISSFSLSKTSDRPKGRSEKCWCTIFSQYQAPLVWNSLPLKIRLCSSLSSFKSQLKTYLFLSAFQ